MTRRAVIALLAVATFYAGHAAGREDQAERAEVAPVSVPVVEVITGE